MPLHQRIVQFYPGVCDASKLASVPWAFIPVHRIQNRRKPLPQPAGAWGLDSGGFNALTRLGHYDLTPQQYAALVRRFAEEAPGLTFAAAQDYVATADALAATGLSSWQHILLTVSRYDRQVQCDFGHTHLLPVIQGSSPDEYRRCLDLYGDRLPHGTYAGVGAVAMRSPQYVAAVLEAVHSERPDLRLHGFGVALRALSLDRVRRHLVSADSGAWSRAARLERRSAHDAAEAIRYERRVATSGVQRDLFSL